MVGERLDRHRLSELARDADDEAELELEVEAAAGAEGRRVLVGSLPWPLGRTTSVPLTTTLPARPW